MRSGGENAHGLHTTREIAMELESRDALSAVARGWNNGGGLVTTECYRCLTTTSKLWHEYGKLRLPMCNGCVVMMHRDVCGWCGTASGDKGHTLFNCSVCLRPVHEGCEMTLRGKPNPHNLCVVCELKARIKHRDYVSHLSLIPADLSSLLNYHIFTFSRFFLGAGPRLGHKETGEASLPEISKTLVGTGHGVTRSMQERDGAKTSMAHIEEGLDKEWVGGVAERTVTGVHRQDSATPSMTFSLNTSTVQVTGGKSGRTDRAREWKPKGGNKQTGGAFDKLLTMTTMKDVHVRERSLIMDIQREMSAKWNENNSQKSASQHFKRASMYSSMNSTSMSDIQNSTKNSPKLYRSKKSHLKELAIINQIEPTLIELGLCYFTRPFRDDKGGRRYLCTNEVFVLFAQDFDLVPNQISRLECLELIYKTLSENPAFADQFRELMREREMKETHLSQTGSESFTSFTPPENSVGTHEDKQAQMHEKHGFLAGAFLAFLQTIAQFGHRRAQSPAQTQTRRSKALMDDEDFVFMERKQTDRASMSIVEVVEEIMQLHDPEVVAQVLAKYPTQEQLDQKLREEIAEAEQRRISTEVTSGRRKPYPLEESECQSEQMSIWYCRLAEIFEFFVNPLDDQFQSSESVDDDIFRIGKCFRTLDCDQDGLISRADATAALVAAGNSSTEAKYISDVLLSTVYTRSNEDGITWDEFTQVPPPYKHEWRESMGTCWTLLFEECGNARDRLLRAVQIQQRDIANIWVEATGRTRYDTGDEGLEWSESDHLGLGAMFAVDDKGRTVVHKVARPGPADGKLWGGDIVVAIDGKNVENLGPGEVIGMLIAAGGEEGGVSLTLRRKEDVEEEVLSRKPPALLPTLPAYVEKRDPLRMAQGEIGFSSVLKILRLLGLLPKVLIAEEVVLICGALKPVHNWALDGEMFFSYEEFRSLLGKIIETPRFYKTIKSHITLPVGRRCFQLLQPSEQGLGALFLLMQLPRRNVPGGVGWMKIRYYNYVGTEMAHQQEILGEKAVFSDMRSNVEIRIMSMFQDSLQLINSDGLSQYFEACKQKHVVPDRHVTEKLLNMHAIFQLDSHALRKKEAAAMMGGFRGNHHVQKIILKNVGLEDTAVRELRRIFEEEGCLSTKLQHLDLSNNPIGFHKSNRSSSDGLGAVGDVIQMVKFSRVLSEIRLCGVGLGDRDACAFCDAMIGANGAGITKLDLSDNQISDRSCKRFARVILKCDRVLYINLTWNHFSPSGTATMLKAVAQRDKNEAEEKERQRRMKIEMESISLSATFPDRSARSSQSGRSRKSRNKTPVVSEAFNDDLAVKIEDHGPFGPKEGMYEFHRLDDKTLTQTVEYLDHLRSKTKWDGVEEGRERQVERKLVLLLEIKPERQGGGKSPCKSSEPQGKRSGSSGSPMKRAKSTGSRISTSGSVKASVSGPANLIDQDAYLDLKAHLDDVASEGLSVQDRLSLLQMRLRDRRLRVLQVWEQLLPFQGSNVLYAATRFLHSRLGSQEEIDKVQALQSIYDKPRNQIFIPDDAKLPRHSSSRRRARTPIEGYLDPAAKYRQQSPDKRAFGQTFDPDKLMATVSAKLRMRSVKSKLKATRVSMPNLTKQVNKDIKEKTPKKARK